MGPYDSIRFHTKPDKTVGSPFEFFPTLFRIFSCLQRASFKFLNVSQKKEFEKAQSVSSFTFFCTLRLFQKVFNSEIKFSQYIPTNFFQYFLYVISGMKRYLQIFDVIPEIICVLLRRRHKIDLFEP